MLPYEIPVRPKHRFQTYSSPIQSRTRVKAISRDYPHSLPDKDVLEISRKEQRVLIVADRDFGELIFQQGLAHSGVTVSREPAFKPRSNTSIPRSVNTLTILSSGNS